MSIQRQGAICAAGLLGLTACTTSSSDAAVDGTSTSGAHDSEGSTDGSTGEDSTSEATSHIHLEAPMVAIDGQLAFLTAAGSIVEHPQAYVAGKTFYAAVFEGGFAQGLDLPLAVHWGTVPDDLSITATFDVAVPDGPYDVSLIVYTETPIDPASTDLDSVPIPVAGELSAFTLSQDEIRDGDPSFANGVVRVNVAGADATVTLTNRADPEDIGGSFVDTILVVP